MAAARHFDRHAALLLEQVERVLRQKTAIPLRALVGRIGAALGGEVGARLVGVVSDRLHRFVVELDGLVGGEGDALDVERVRQTHHAETDRAVAHIRALGRLGRVEVDVDDVVQRAHGDADRLAEFLVVERAVGHQVRVEDDRAEIADRGLVVRRVERDLGAEIGRVDDADVVLRASGYCRRP